MKIFSSIDMSIANDWLERTGADRIHLYINKNGSDILCTYLSSLSNCTDNLLSKMWIQDILNKRSNIFSWEKYVSIMPMAKNMFSDYGRFFTLVRSLKANTEPPSSNVIDRIKILHDVSSYREDRAEQLIRTSNSLSQALLEDQVNAEVAKINEVLEKIDTYIKRTQDNEILAIESDINALRNELANILKAATETPVIIHSPNGGIKKSEFGSIGGTPEKTKPHRYGDENSPTPKKDKSNWNLSLLFAKGNEKPLFIFVGVVLLLIAVFGFISTLSRFASYDVVNIIFMMVFMLMGVVALFIILSVLFF